MPNVLAFLRAINVGGRRVTGDELVRIATDAGFEDVSSFLASGNLALDAGDAAPEVVETRLEAALEAGLGYTAEVFVRTADQVAAILDAQPFDTALVEASGAKPQIGFLRSAPDDDAAAAAEALATDRDHLAVVGAEWHWLPLDGVGRAALDQKALGRLLGPTTVRTRNTVARMQSKYLT